MVLLAWCLMNVADDYVRASVQTGSHSDPVNAERDWARIWTFTKTPLSHDLLALKEAPPPKATPVNTDLGSNP